MATSRSFSESHSTSKGEAGQDRVLLVEDQDDHAALIEIQLSAHDGGRWTVERVATLRDAVAAAAAWRPDVVVLDLNLPDSRGLATVNAFCHAHPDLPVVVATVEADETIGVEAVRIGAQDCLVKGLTAPEVIGRTLHLAMARKDGERAAARLASIVAASEDAIIGLDLDSRITSWNGGAERLYGYDASEAIGRTVAMLWPRDRQDDCGRTLERVRAGDRVPSSETTTVGKDGSVLAVSVHLSPILGAAGRPVGASMIARDISERWRAAEAVRLSREYLKTVVDNEPECLKIITPDGIILEMNPAGLEMLDAASTDQVVGRHMTDFIHGDDHGELATAQSLAMRGERARVRYRIITLTGRTRSVESIVTSLPRNGSGQVLLSLTRDVTEQQLAAESLRRSEERYRTLFDGNPQPLWVFDAESLSFLAVNDAACRRYGYSRTEFLGMTLRDIRPAEELDRLRELLAVTGDQARAPVVVRHQSKDGRIILAEVTSHPIQFDGRRAEFVVAVDVTERSRLEEQLRQSQKMEALGRLAGGVAHDFNNLLGVITGYSQMALRDVGQGAPAVRRLEEVVKAASRAADLTHQLLAFSRKQVLEAKVLDLNASVAEATKMLRRLIGENIELVPLAAERLGRVKADPGQVLQIIMNLSLNARDAMSRGGRLTIETANAEIGARPRPIYPEAKPGRYVLLAVSDTGEGMDAATRSRIFEPFFTTKEAGKGTGLGLATVYGIVRQSGGHIEVYSEPGRGSTFKVYLPRVDGVPETTVASKPQTSLGGTETILLVEDDPALRAMTRELLEDVGYRVIAADAGDAAVDRASTSSEPIDLVLTDVVMPRMTGPELAKKIGERLHGVRVLFMSGYTEGAILESSDLPQDSAFLSKPFTRDGLLAKVRELLDAR